MTFVSVQVLKERAESDLKKAADNHWSDGALEVCTSSSYLLQFMSHKSQGFFLF
jgi:hypothetical protein